MINQKLLSKKYKRYNNHLIDLYLINHPYFTRAGRSKSYFDFLYTTPTVKIKGNLYIGVLNTYRIRKVRYMNVGKVFIQFYGTDLDITMNENEFLDRMEFNQIDKLK